VILGAGESGVGAAYLAKKEGWDVFVSDFGMVKEEFQSELNALNVAWEQGGHDLEKILQTDLVVKSPGIPDTASVVVELKKAGVRIISEIEFAAHYSKAKFVAITGSNGKTTTTMLTHHILKKAGVDVGLAGNVGKSLAKQVAEKDCQWYVLELSSFQLDDMFDFKADIAILTNITPDHLDRYNYEMQNYVNAKFRILQNQTKNDWFIYNYDDPIIQQEIEKVKIVAKQAPFSLKDQISLGGFADEKQITINIKEQLTMSIHDLALKGKHNTQNSLASGIAARIMEIRKEIVRESLEDFVNVEHRLEFVAKVHGI
jgi:UDP-N-acetylmuramoylalanine--D-glutamate ligase